MMGLDNPLHLLFLGIVLLLLFGAKRLPELGSSLGTGLREFRQATSGTTQPPATDQPNVIELPYQSSEPPDSAA